jgi:hypothetical protein
MFNSFNTTILFNCHVLTLTALDIFCIFMYEHDVIWYGEYGDLSFSSVRNTFNNIKNQNEDGGGQHNWTDIEIDEVIATMKYLKTPCG